MGNSGEKLREMFDIPLEFSPEKAQELLLKGKLPPEDIVVGGDVWSSTKLKGKKPKSVEGRRYVVRE